MPEKSNISYPFTRFQHGNDYVLRPIIPCVIKSGTREMKVDLMLDTGADISMIRKEMLEFLGVSMKTCPSAGTTSCADGKSSQVSSIELTVEITGGKYTWRDSIPFLFFLEEGKDPDPPILGRHPFFNNYRIDFRMGFTNDPKLGKFVIYKEEVKRDSKRYTKSDRSFGK
jgi:hypothetical protein